MNLHPLSDHIILEKIEESNVTASGIYLSSDSMTKSTRGKIIAIGDGVNHVSIGDTVYYKKYAGEPIEVEKKEYIILRQDGLVAKEIN